MQVNTLALQHLFEKDVQYRVPLYQRPYVWNEEDQWQYLWNDIRRLAEAVLGGKDPGYHFLGATVQDLETVPPGMQEARLLIDGQQRLTTLQVLAKSFLDVVKRAGDERYAAAAKRLAFNSHPLSRETSDAYKVWPTNADRAALEKVMQADGPSDLLKQYRKSATAITGEAIPDAYLYFFREMERWIGTEDQAGRIAVLYPVLRDRLKLVVIDLERGDDAQMIFETLNARGTPLLAADLLKNSLLAELGSDEKQVATAYDRYWKAFDEEQRFWREEVGRGHARKPRIEGLMQHAIALMSGEEVASSEVYTAYRRFARSDLAGSAVDRMKKFRRYGDVYRSLVQGGHEHKLSTFLYRLDAMDLGSAFPFLIELLDRRPGDVALLSGVTAILDSFLVRRMICRLSTRGYSRLFLELAGLSLEGDDLLERIGERLRVGTAENDRWPGDLEFEKAWRENPLYAVLTRARMRMVLEALEEALRSDRAEERSCPRNLTIEHIMPQGWREHWSLSGEDNRLEQEVARDGIIHTIGNLTLLTGPMNGAQSNRPWQATATIPEGKRSALAKHTVLHLNKSVADQEAWDDQHIAARASSLFGVARSIWAPP